MYVGYECKGVSVLVSHYVCVCVCSCIGQAVKVGLAWSHDITRLRGLLASQTAPPPLLPLTSLTSSHFFKKSCSLVSSLSFLWYKAETKGLCPDRSTRVSSEYAFFFFFFNFTLPLYTVGVLCSLSYICEQMK